MSEVRAVLSAVLLACGVSAAVAVAVVRMTDGEAPGIVSVRLGELAAEHAETAARGGAAPEEIRASTRLWAAALEWTLRDIARRRDVVLLPSRAVAAGAPDATDIVRRMVEDRMKQAASGREVRP